MGKRKRRRRRRGGAGGGRNPDLLTISANPGRALFAHGIAAYQKFHGGIRPNVRRMRFPRGAPRILVEIGKLREVVYQVGRGGRRGAAWLHKFGKGARLAADPKGEQLYIVRGKGSRMRVDWRRGIVG